MTRLKFLVFAVATFALALVGIAGFSEHAATGARARAQEHLEAARARLELRMRLAQAEATAALMAAASDPLTVGAWATLPSDAAPTQASAEVVRGAVLEALRAAPEPLRAPSWILVGNPQGVVALPPAEGEPTTASDPNAFNLQRASDAGAAGAFALAQGRIYRVAAVPVRATGEAALGLVGVAYRLDESLLHAESTALGASITLLARGTALSTLPKTARAQVIGASDGPIALAALPSLGPVALPLLTGDVAPALRLTTALWGLENGNAVLTAEVRGLDTLASVQKRAFLGLLALLLLAATLLVRRGPRAAMKATVPASLPTQARPEAAAAPNPAELPAPVPEPMPAAAEAPAAAADSTLPTATPPVAEPAAEPAPSAGPAWAAWAPSLESLDSLAPAAAPGIEAAEAPPAPVEYGHWPPPPEALAADASGPELIGTSASQEPVAAEPLPAPATAFAPADAAAVPLPAPEPATVAAPASPEAIRLPAPEQESTVVAAVPEQLLRAAARVRPAAETPTPFATPSAVPLPGPAGEDPDEPHFREIFERFLTTRAECNEPAEGLAYERFAAKLRKNRDALMQKYGCRSVRFQVYVKEGKAALKASPQR